MWRTMHHVGGSYARELRAIVDDAFALANERVKQDEAVVVDQRNTREGRFRSVNPDTNHFAVEGEVFPRSETGRACEFPTTQGTVTAERRGRELTGRNAVH